MSLEDALRDALRREEPPPGFAARVMKRVDPRVAPARRPASAAWWRFAAAAAACALLFAGVERYREQRAREESARRQIAVALRITSEALESVRDQVRRSAANRRAIPVSPELLTVSKEKL